MTAALENTAPADYSNPDDWFGAELAGLNVDIPSPSSQSCSVEVLPSEPKKSLALAVRHSAVDREAASPNKWDPRLVIDIALELAEPKELLDRYGLDFEDLAALMRNPVFRHEVASAGRELREKGLTFQRKAAAQAETYLSVLDSIVTGTETPASTKLAAIQSVVKWGHLEPKEVKNDGGGSGPTVNVQINF